MKKIRFGFLGASKIGNSLADAISHIDEAELYAVAARDINKAETYKKKWNFQKAYGNYEKMLQDKNVDVVYISTIHSLHYEHCLLALKYNKPVLCEKSLTTSLKDTMDLYKRFEEKGVLLVEALWTSFQPFNETLKTLLFKDNIIGNIQMIKSYFNLNIIDIPRIKQRNMGGGAILDLGIYPLSFVYRLLTSNYSDLKIVRCRRRRNVDINDKILLKYPNNITAEVYTKVNAFMVRNEATIKGDNGHILINGTTYPTEIKIYSKRNKLLQQLDISNEFGGYIFEVKSFIDAYKNKQKECKEHTHFDSIEIAKLQDKIVN